MRGAAHLEHRQPPLHLTEYFHVTQQDDRIGECRAADAPQVGDGGGVRELALVKNSRSRYLDRTSSGRERCEYSLACWLCLRQRMQTARPSLCVRRST